jgi:A/G-specific adenine glycosylase
MAGEALLSWYEAVRRPLPWRFTRDPWALLVSEVMLQQTQAARVVPHYERFLARFPSAASFAAASPADAIAAWSGLGYNRRALSLQAAARAIAAVGWPERLEDLPGVGPYTAAAVASFAWDAQVAAVDTNVRRVAQRIGVAPAELLPERRHADWNQAAMELGARVCRARAPSCDACPAAPWCGSRGRVEVAPRAAGATAPRFEETDRWLRGRIVAALAAGASLPAGIEPARLERALAGLERDGLVERDGSGVGLPRQPR